MNRIRKHFRDPALEEPATDFFVVRVPFERLVVAREQAERLLAAMTTYQPPSVVRCQTIYGSVVFIRPETVLYVRECTKAQRDAERRFWKEIDDEDEDDDGDWS